MEELATWKVLDPRLDNGDCVKVAAELMVGCGTGVSDVDADGVGSVETDVEIAAEDNAEVNTNSDSTDWVVLRLVYILVCVDCSTVCTVAFRVVFGIAVGEPCPLSAITTFEQTAPTPTFLKNKPIRVSFSALAPLHRVLIRSETSSSCFMHFIEQTRLEKSSGHCVRGVLYAFVQSSEK